jgi:DNA-binding transcriptional ArsR family regulator
MPRPTDPGAAFTADAALRPGYFVQHVRADFVRAGHAFTPTARLLYILLLSYINEGATVWPGQARLARELGVSEPVVRRHIAELKSAALLTVQRLGQGRTNRYHLHVLPTKATWRERKNLAFLNQKNRRPRPPESAANRESANPESGEESRPQNPPAFTPAPGLRTADEIHAEQRRRRL